jgi:hypothetical protein
LFSYSGSSFFGLRVIGGSEKMNKIQELIAKYDWVLQCWNDRYGRGIWAVVAPHVNYVYEMRQIIDGGDIESLTLGDYFHNEGSWLPVSNGCNLSEVLTKLEEKISNYIDNSSWQKSVDNAFLRIIEINDGHYGLQIAIENKDKYLLKPKLDE